MEEKDKNSTTSSIGAMHLKDYTTEMYNNTIEEMKKRGATQEELDVVERAKASSIDAYNEDMPKKSENCGTIKILLNPELNFVPLMSNLFIVKVGEVPVNMVRYLSIDDNKKIAKLSVFETKEFSPFKYFSENRKHNGIVLEHLDMAGNTIRVDKIYRVKAKSLLGGAVCYDNSYPLYTEITFKYKKYVPSAD